MTIATARVAPFAIPYKQPLELAGATVTLHRGLLVTISDGAGHTGCGEIAPGPGTTAAEVAQLATTAGDTARALLGSSVESAVNAANLNLGSSAYPTNHPPAAIGAGFEAALLDLQSRRRARPLHQLLGKHPSGGRTIAAVAVNTLLARSAPEAALRAARDAVARGFSTLKVKVDPRLLGSTLETLHAIRDELGPDIRLRLDCNGQWTVAEAAAGLAQLERFDLEYIEQPTDSLEGLAELRRTTGVPIAADESAADLAAIERAIELGAADVLVLKPARTGLLGSVEAARRALSCGIGVVVTSNLDTSIGIAAALHLAAAVDSLAGGTPYAHGLATAGLLQGDLVERPLIADGGLLRLPDGCGSGVAADLGQLHRWSARTQEPSRHQSPGDRDPDDGCDPKRP